MLVVGITGGIATGKSQATRLLAEAGAVAFSADEAARAILQPNGRVLKAIAGTLGEESLLSDGTLNRTRIAEIVFADVFARERLNRITHPPIMRLLQAQIESVYYEISPQCLVVVEVPLLYESGLQNRFDVVVVVTASEPTQKARLLQNRGMNETQARQRLAAQMPLEEKRQLADIVIENEGNLAELAGAIHELAKRLTAQAKVPQNQKFSLGHP